MSLVSALLLLALALVASGARLPSTTRQKALCLPCQKDEECRSNFCFPNVVAGLPGFCAISPNYFDTILCAHALQTSLGPSASASASASASSSSSSSGSGRGSGFGFGSSSNGETASSSDTSPPSAPEPARRETQPSSGCPRCVSGSDCLNADGLREPDLRCVNGRCVQSLSRSAVDACFPNGLLSEFGSRGSCDFCEARGDCASGVCINHKCIAGADYAALQQCE